MIFAIVAVVALVLVFARSLYECSHFIVKEYNIKSSKVKDTPVTFGFISDLHNCCYGRKNEKIIEALKENKCEFLIIGGDMINGKRDIKNKNPEKYYKNATEFLNRISSEMKVYYTFGNHETRTKNRKSDNPLFSSFMESIKGCDITFLNNEKADINDNISVCGLEIPEEAYKNEKYYMENMEIDSERFNILVAHMPDYFMEYAKTGAELILCGHNHGGTIRLPFIGGVISRRYKLFPEYSYGLYKTEKSEMIFTSGLGDHSIHFRLFNMPEIVAINIF